MAKRIFEIAKELGVKGAAIVEKCHAEGISHDVVKNHMSAISAGLEATIREWFSSGSHGTTAVETAAPVNLSSARAKPGSRKKTVKSDAPESGEDAHSDTATIAVQPQKPAARPMPAPPPPAEPSAEPAEPARARQIPKPARVEPKPEARPDFRPDARPESSPLPTTRATRHPADEAKPAQLAPAAKAPEQPNSPGSSSPGTHRPSDGGTLKPHLPRPAPQRTTVTPAPMNVPNRPTVVSPAGPKLATPTAVKLSGPKVVRVEAPENIEAPRSRRPAGSTGGGMSSTRGPRTGTGAGPAEGGGEDDRGRNVRRKSSGAGSGAAAAAAANAKRSSGQGVPDKRRGRSGQDWVGSTQGIFSEQDLIEREARLARAGGFVRKHKQDLRRGPGAGPQATPAQIGGKVQIAAPFTIKDLSERTGVKGSDIVKKLFMQGIMLKINDPIETEKAVELMMDLNIELEVTQAKTAEEAVSHEYEKRDAVELRPRGAVVTILGHVDHGKTSLLDKIRNANVAAGEAGGITQRTSAFRVPLEISGEQKELIFLDTPGHEAFTGMRSRGARITDVVVLVVSGPEGVMPQTIESVNHAKAAGVPIVVALNKMDRPDATTSQINKTLGQLAEAGLNPIEWGGDVEVVRTSATTGMGIKELLEVLDLQSQILELKADFGGHARGTVIEARTEEGRGSVANLLVQDGRLNVGDFIVAGRAFGRVRDITDDRGNKIKGVTPPSPVQISGLDEVPDAGDKFYVVDSLKEAQDAAEQRRMRERQTQLAQPKVTLDSLFGQMTDKEVKEILVVLKAAEQGTVDVLKGECEKIKTSEVKVRVLHGAVGGITESDVLLADASRAIIIGFNVIPSGKARTLAEQKGVEIRTYDVIYNITDDLKKAAEGLLTPELRQEVLGHAEVRQVFKVSKVGSIAGCYITDGTVQRDALIRVTRNGVVVENDRRLEQLKRFKDDAKEVRAGMECGMKIVGYDDIKEGDVLECYKQVEVKRSL